MSKSSQATSIAIHGLLIILLLAVGMHPAVIREAQKAATIVDPPRLPRGAAGGGGNHEREPARKGMLPTRSTRVFSSSPPFSTAFTKSSSFLTRSSNCGRVSVVVGAVHVLVGHLVMNAACKSSQVALDVAGKSSYHDSAGELDLRLISK